MRKKIIFGFLLSAAIISALSVFEYVNFIQVRSEMNFLEVADTVRSKSLQLRRHEKNFFLFPDKAAEESASTRDYLSQLQDVTASINSQDPDKVNALRNLLGQYQTEFGAIETMLAQINQDFENSRSVFGPNPNTVPLLEAESRDHPLQVAEFLQTGFSLPAGSPLVARLRDLDGQINRLRDTGENILSSSEELDADARDSAARGIRVSQYAILIFFPLFLLLGLGALLYISGGVVRRLKTLTDSVEKIGARYAHGSSSRRPEGGHQDEVDVLVEKFNNMNTQLIQWEEEIDEKNRELYQSKKLAAIGTLAAGVAHELNNPLNNINISAQVLKRQFQDDASPDRKEIIDEIVGQTARLKGIVGNLLEFAREREPQKKAVDLGRVIRTAYGLAAGPDITGINFVVDSDGEGVTLYADPNQLERVFVNLFSNAIAAMSGEGQLAAQIRNDTEVVRVYVSDTGKGIPADDREKIFDPFFTQKDKGAGLGLAIVMNIVRNHGGDISVVSEEDMGTVFEIVIPRGEA